MKVSKIFFTLNKQVNYGEGVFIVFNFTNWNLRKAIRMECWGNDYWTKEIEISCSYFEYKYVVGQYENIFEREIIWEKGPNRSSENLKLLKMCQSKIHIQDAWDKRTQIFFLIDRKQKIKSKNNLQHDILLFGQVKALNSPVKFTECQLNKKTQLYFVNLQLEVEEVTNPIQVQIYMQAQIEERLIEIISKSVTLNFRNQPINICEVILPESKCCILK